MPVTSGSGNPKWTRDETLLALDLLYRHGKPIDKNHADAAELSRLLRAARIYPETNRKESFRNADGVALKTQNLFSALNPERRLSSSDMDRKVVVEFPTVRKLDLAQIANAIRQALSDEAATVLVRDDEFEVTEGKVLAARHRQRDGRLREKLIEARRANGLRCEICDFAVNANAPRAAESLFEGHHTIPLAAAEGERTTRLSDMALLCACCHRFIHRLIVDNKRWVGIPEAAEARKALV
ncbi:MAG: HNH endonuclease [Mesorhizobium sp.]|uniref:HNH endonuclease n=1 Tax=unclassified Mesorhizobium TaxID=325217 RepID=UPI000FE6EF2B|nr:MULTISPECIES: HNH endonuclease [unclassified Mesorhizobium]MDG4908751.1 HNH endonuclease [Mesorhizobium sp. WSM4898]RWI98868.1 MAG: HNH endonuclease [Mesorhizobium sp.]TIR23405.1 MAG: HNH endonuclease [Mesorhizobium sp.]